MYIMPFRFGHDLRLEENRVVFEITNKWRNRLPYEQAKKVFEADSFESFVFGMFKTVEKYWVEGCRPIEVAVEIAPGLSNKQIKVVFLERVGDGLVQSLLRVGVEWADPDKVRDFLSGGLYDYEFSECEHHVVLK